MRLIEYWMEKTASRALGRIKSFIGGEVPFFHSTLSPGSIAGMKDRARSSGLFKDMLVATSPLESLSRGGTLFPQHHGLGRKQLSGLPRGSNFIKNIGDNSYLDLPRYAAFNLKPNYNGKPRWETKSDLTKGIISRNFQGILGNLPHNVMSRMNVMHDNSIINPFSEYFRNPDLISLAAFRPQTQRYGSAGLLTKPSKFLGKRVDYVPDRLQKSVGELPETMLAPIGHNRRILTLPRAEGLGFYIPRKSSNPQDILWNKQQHELGLLPYSSRVRRKVEAISKGRESGNPIYSGSKPFSSTVDLDMLKERVRRRAKGDVVFEQKKGLRGHRRRAVDKATQKFEDMWDRS